LFVIKYLAGLLLVFMGSMDCLTTVVGTLYFGTRELNPLIAGLLPNNVPIFILIKLAVTVSVAATFVLVEKTLLKTPNYADKSFRVAYNTLRVACVGITVFLVIVVLNNVLVLLATL
jgi:hypothetical protein